MYLRYFLKVNVQNGIIFWVAKIVLGMSDIPDIFGGKQYSLRMKKTWVYPPGNNLWYKKKNTLNSKMVLIVIFYYLNETYKFEHSLLTHSILVWRNKKHKGPSSSPWYMYLLYRLACTRFHNKHVQLANEAGCLLSLCVPIEFPVKLDTVKSGWPIVYIEGSQAIISKNVIFLSLKIDFILGNSADPDEMPRNAAFHLGFHGLPKYMYLMVHRGLFGLYVVIQLYNEPAKVQISKPFERKIAIIFFIHQFKNVFWML